jgi:hypothetical protein
VRVLVDSSMQSIWPRIPAAPSSDFRWSVTPVSYRTGDCLSLGCRRFGTGRHDGGELFFVRRAQHQFRTEFAAIAVADFDVLATGRGHGGHFGRATGSE